MDKDEILQKSREENAAAFMDERERNLRLREDSFALGMSAAGFLFRCVKSRKKSDIFWASLCTLLALFYLCRFFMRAA